MKLAIFGATGRTGVHLVEQALAAGHTVQALARDPSKMPGQGEKLRVIRGDALDAAAVAQTIAGTEAVLSALAQDPRFIINILNGMKQHGVRRLIVAAGAGVPDPNDRPTFLNHAISFLIKTFSRRVYDDALRQNEILRASEVDWTIVRAPMLTDRPRGKLWVGHVGAGMGRTLSRAALAEFMLQQVGVTTYVRAAPVVTDAG